MFRNLDTDTVAWVNDIGRQAPPTFVDAFAGCGGLSLGLMQAGWQGVFAIEQDTHAFETLKANFLADGSRHDYAWPSWLPQAPISINDLMEQYSPQLDQLRGKVDLLAGGPPCQGFSSAGRRDPNDPRNNLVDAYLELVRRLEPDMVLLENVRGITYAFEDNNEQEGTNYSENLKDGLSKDYRVFTDVLSASSFGVPQKRPRFFLIAMRKAVKRPLPSLDPFKLVSKQRKTFFAKKGMPRMSNSRSAISDLEVGRNGEIDCPECKGFKSIKYNKPRTLFQKAMREGFDDPPSATRLARHRPDIKARFAKIIEYCHSVGHLNRSIPKEYREQLGLKKHTIQVLDPLRPAPTITSMPDDLLHYKEPRALTVRENARLQTFPDWFVFKGKYTSGSNMRRREVPRFTQVANAVPPLLAEQLGHCLIAFRPTQAEEK